MLQGTPYLYQGEELGLTNVAFEGIYDYRDIETLNMYQEFAVEKGMDPALVMAMIHAKSRDNADTPMQWDNSENAGFTAGTPWIGVTPNYKRINAAAALEDSDSIFYAYQKLIRLRKELPVVTYGTYELLLPDHEAIYAFTRTLGIERLLVILNFTEEEPVLELPEAVAFVSYDLLVANYPVDTSGDVRRWVMQPYEARVYRLH